MPKRVSRFLVSPTLLALLFCTHGLLWPVFANEPQQAKTEASSEYSDAAEGIEETAHGFDVARVENEYKLSFPKQMTEEIWTYLKKRYDNSNLFLKKYSPDFATALSDEYFRDEYFDDAELHLFNAENGVRHRSRYFPNDPGNRKNGRELVQIKLKRPLDRSTNRTEYKFPVKYYPKRNDPYDGLPLLGIIKRSKRKNFLDQLQEINIDGTALKNTITLNQHRRRVYITLHKKPFATITLDEVSTHKWWRTASFSEIEVEINEIGYTEASKGSKDFMQTVNDTMKSDLLQQFKEIHQDQTPKYNKAFNRLNAKFLLFPLAVALGFPIEAGATLGLILILAWFYLTYRPQQAKRK